ncbi:MAG: YceH family protein [Desulfobulbaceae bacterium]|nr:YceH family protein [Desulfobulbaceae bacterium]
MDFMLNAIEVRVLGSLMEKELATPEYYPLSLNALINACNQKTNRSPVLALDADTVAGALQSLKQQQLVYQSDASRVPKYWQAFAKQKNLISREAALLSLLLLRGPQTAGELRNRSETLCSFENIEEVFHSLENLSTTGLVVQLPRQPGQKEQRFAQLLAGELDMTEQANARQEPVMMARAAASDRITELEKTVATLQEEMAALKQAFAIFKKEFE